MFLALILEKGNNHPFIICVSYYRDADLVSSLVEAFQGMVGWASLRVGDVNEDIFPSLSSATHSLEAGANRFSWV